MRIQLVKSGHTLAPVGDDSLNALSKIPQGELVTVELTRPRNPRWHNMYWHLCGLLLDNSDGQYGSTKQAVSDFLKIAASQVDADGNPRSISSRAWSRPSLRRSTPVSVMWWLPSGRPPPKLSITR